MKRVRLHVLTLVVVTVTLVSACTQTQTRVMTLAPAPVNLFDSAAPVEINGSHVVGDRHGNVIAGAGEGAGTGMLVGAGGSIYGGASTGNPFGLALGIVLAPVFAVGGGIYGAVAAHPSDETEAAVAAIEQVYSDQTLLGALAGKIESDILELSFPTLPSCAEPQGDGASALPSPEDCSPAPSNRLRMTVAYVFSTIGAYSPDLQFGIDVEVVAANSDRTRDAKAFRWAYLSPELDFFAATSDEANVLRLAIADALQQLAEKIVDDLFLARHEVKLSGTYFPKTEGINFQPAAITPGVAVRVPTRSELISVPGIDRYRDAQSELPNTPRVATAPTEEPAHEPLSQPEIQPALKQAPMPSAEPVNTVDPQEQEEECYGTSYTTGSDNVHPWDKIPCDQIG